MDKKIIMIAAIAAVAAVCVAGAYVVLSGDDDKDDDLNLSSYYGLVYGNADGDTDFDEDDLEIIEQAIDDQTLLEEYPLADADNDGTVDQDDYDFVKAIVDGTQSGDTKVKVIDVTGSVVDVPYPLESIFFYGQVNGRTIANVLDLQDVVVCVATNDTYLYDLDSELMSVTDAEGFSGSVPRISSSATDDDITTMSKTTFQAAIIEESGMSGYYGNAAKDAYSKIGAVALQFNFDNAETSLQSVATIGILVQETEKAQKYIDLMDSIQTYIKEKTGDDYGTATVLSVVMSNSVSGPSSDYYAATELAGGDNIADWSGTTKKFNPSNGETWLYESKYEADYMIHFKSMHQDHSLDIDTGTIQGYLDQYTAYFSETTMFKNGGYYLLNGLIPLPARLAYMAEVMYTEDIGTGYGAQIFQEFVDLFTDQNTGDNTWKAAEHTVMWSFKDGSTYVPVTEVTLSSETLELGIGNSAELTYTYSPEGATVYTPIWTSSDESVATVSLGVVTAVAAGTATITMELGNATATCAVTVQDIPVTGIELAESITIGIANPATLTYTVVPANANKNTPTVTSSDENVVTVGDGVITGVAAGTATVTVTAGGQTATCAVTVKDTAATGITWTSGQTNTNDYKIMRGTTTTTYDIEFTLGPATANATALSVTSDNESIVDVTSYSVKDGVVTVSLERVDVSTKALVTITVSIGDVSCTAACRCNGWALSES